MPDPIGSTVPGVDPAAAVSPPGRPRVKSRWPLAVLAASGVGLPIGCLLCYGALLPFFLGLFFFLLFGLLLGAVLYRVGQTAKPLSRGSLVTGAAVVVTVTWATSLLTECYDFPRQVAKFAYEKIPKLPEDSTPDTFRASVAADVARHLREKYPPGGAIGYVRWAVTSSRIDRSVSQLRKPFIASQYRWWWLVRVVLTIFLLSYGVYSQVSSLDRLHGGTR